MVIRSRLNDFKCPGSPQQYTLTFDALLIGHEAGVTSVAWRPVQVHSPSNEISNSPPTLLSTSTDSSLILWSPTSHSTAASAGSPSVWTNRQRFGDVGGVKAGGFVGGLWAGRGMQVVGWGWNGSWRRWGATSDTELEWTEMGGVGGHQGPVRGVTWDPTGRFLLSTRLGVLSCCSLASSSMNIDKISSLDQTSRIHGAWSHPSPMTSSTSSIESWHEIARPQIHGYDLISATFIGSYKFVSVADEKVARVFDAPKGFLNTLKGIDVEDATVDTVRCLS